MKDKVCRKQASVLCAPNIRLIHVHVAATITEEVYHTFSFSAYAFMAKIHYALVNTGKHTYF